MTDGRRTAMEPPGAPSECRSWRSHGRAHGARRSSHRQVYGEAQYERETTSGPGCAADRPTRDRGRVGAVAARCAAIQSWALLARLVLADRQLSRRELSAELFPETVDPLGSLRWCLAGLRRAVGSAEAFSGDPVALNLPAGTRIDVTMLRARQIRRQPRRRAPRGDRPAMRCRARHLAAGAPPARRRPDRRSDPDRGDLRICRPATPTVRSTSRRSAYGARSSTRVLTCCWSRASSPRAATMPPPRTSTTPRRCSAPSSESRRRRRCGAQPAAHLADAPLRGVGASRGRFAARVRASRDRGGRGGCRIGVLASSLRRRGALPRRAARGVLPARARIGCWCTRSAVTTTKARCCCNTAPTSPNTSATTGSVTTAHRELGFVDALAGRRPAAGVHLERARRICCWRPRAPGRRSLGERVQPHRLGPARRRDRRIPARRSTSPARAPTNAVRCGRWVSAAGRTSWPATPTRRRVDRTDCLTAHHRHSLGGIPAVATGRSSPKSTSLEATPPATCCADLEQAFARLGFVRIGAWG